MTIRKATPEDAERLLAIYTPHIEDTAITFEYDVPTVEEFRQRIKDTLREYPYLVAEDDGRIIGYAYAGPLKRRAAYQWAVETSIYLDKDYRGKGFGTVLQEALEEALRQRGILNLYACISYIDPEDEYLSLDSVRFHEHMGFQLAARFHQCGKKFGRWYDVVWMEKIIGEHE